MKKFVAVMADGSFINLDATRMEIVENFMLVWIGDELVAYINTSWIASAHMSERREERGRIG